MRASAAHRSDVSSDRLRAAAPPHISAYGPRELKENSATLKPMNGATTCKKEKTLINSEGEV